LSGTASAAATCGSGLGLGDRGLGFDLEVRGLGLRSCGLGLVLSLDTRILVNITAVRSTRLVADRSVRRQQCGLSLPFL